MAVLTRLDKKKICSPWVAAVIRDLNQSKNLNFSDLEPVAQYTEDWIETNQASYVAGLPEPFKSSTDAAAKILMFIYTAAKRGNVLPSIGLPPID